MLLGIMIIENIDICTLSVGYSICLKILYLAINQYKRVHGGIVLLFRYKLCT